MKRTKRKKGPKLFSESVGTRGCTVQVRERVPGGNLYLRVGGRWKGLKHRDLELARASARKLAGSLLAADAAKARGTVTLAAVFAEYEQHVIAHRARPSYKREEQYRLDLWTVFLGDDFDVAQLDGTRVDEFVRARRETIMRVPNHRPLKKVKFASAMQDVQWLQSVLDWACRRRIDGVPLLGQNPVAGYAPGARDARTLAKRPQLRPATTFERFEAIDAVAEQADPWQGFFRWYHRLIEALGWRATALCELRRSDLDLHRGRDVAPYGRIRKPIDKMARVAEGEDVWVPLSEDARAAVDGLLELRGAIIGEAWLFPHPMDSARCWTRGTADYRLRRAEEFAGLEHLKGGSLHPYRRKWFTERKEHPVADVAMAGDCTAQNVLRYTKADERTMFAVVNEKRKLVASVAGGDAGVTA